MPIKPGELDAFRVCHGMLELVLTSRRHLASMQQRVRTCFSPDAVAPPPVERDDAECGTAVAHRDAARLELMQRLQAVIDHATSACTERAKALAHETASLSETEERLGAEPAARLVALQSEALPLISRCMREVDRAGVELEELKAVEGAELSHLQTLHGAWKRAADSFIDAEAAVKKGGEGAAEALDRARAQVQRAEAALRSTRTELSALASAYLPEWLAIEPVLRLCEVDGVAIPGMLVKRQLSHYSELQKLSGPPDTLHHVFTGVFNGKRSVLKEYTLDGKGDDWRRLQREVRILSELRHPLISEVECLFESERAGLRFAYMQLRHYDAGDMQAWLLREKPGVLPRKAALHEISLALRHFHGHGFAHGDVKLPNVLMAAQGESQRGASGE